MYALRLKLTSLEMLWKYKKTDKINHIFNVFTYFFFYNVIWPPKSPSPRIFFIVLIACYFAMFAFMLYAFLLGEEGTKNNEIKCFKKKMQIPSWDFYSFFCLFFVITATRMTQHSKLTKLSNTFILSSEKYFYQL